MSLQPANYDSSEDGRILRRSFGAAVLFEALLLTAFGWNGHWLAHPPKNEVDTSHFLEAQIFELPPEAQLNEAKPTAVHAKPEATLSKVVHKGREAKADENKVEENNQTQSGPPMAPSHGPVAIFAPPPHIPAYLQDQEIHASVMIDFLVSAQGVSTPRLAGSSGNEELDAIALASARKWQFRPAEKNHQAIDSKVRLRVVFEVQ